VLSGLLQQPVPGDHVPRFARKWKTKGGLFALFYVLRAVPWICSTVDSKVEIKRYIRRRRRYNFLFKCNSHRNIRAQNERKYSVCTTGSMVSSLQGLRFCGTEPALNNNMCSSSISKFIFAINYFCYSIKIIICLLSCATWHEEDSYLLVLPFITI